MVKVEIFPIVYVSDILNGEYFPMYVVYDGFCTGLMSPNRTEMGRSTLQYCFHPMFLCENEYQMFANYTSNRRSGTQEISAHLCHLYPSCQLCQPCRSSVGQHPVEISSVKLPLWVCFPWTPDRTTAQPCPHRLHSARQQNRTCNGQLTLMQYERFRLAQMQHQEHQRQKQN